MQKIKQSYKDFKNTLQMVTEKILLERFEQQNRCDRAQSVYDSLSLVQLKIHTE